MNWHEFVFSEKPGHRIRRHVSFGRFGGLILLTYDYYFQVGLQKIVVGNLAQYLSSCNPCC